MALHGLAEKGGLVLELFFSSQLTDLFLKCKFRFFSYTNRALDIIQLQNVQNLHLAK